MKKSTALVNILTDGERIWVHRPDDPAKPRHPITPNGAREIMKRFLELDKFILQCEWDYFNEQHKL